MCMIVKIDKLSHEMRGIAKIDNKVTFVDKVITNETIESKAQEFITLYQEEFNGIY